MGFKLFEVARVATDDKRIVAKVRSERQNAKAKIDAAERIAKITDFARECIEARAPAAARESWIVSAMIDLLSGRSYSPREHEILARALAKVRREMGAVAAAD